jgi:hypothetical protein
MTVPRAKRPLSVTAAALSLLAFALINGWRFAALTGQSDLLLELGGGPDPRWRMGLALVWAILFLDAAVALWRGRGRSRKSVPLILFLYAAYELSLLAWFARSPVARQGWLVDLLFYLLLIGWSSWALNRTAVQPYFEANHDKSKY